MAGQGLIDEQDRPVSRGCEHGLLARDVGRPQSRLDVLLDLIVKLLNLSRLDTRLPEEFTGLYYVAPGGNTSESFPASLPTSAMLTLRLVVRQDGETVGARLCDTPVGCPKDAINVTLEPSVPLDVSHSADGRYIYIRPQEFLEPGETYKLKVGGKYYTGGYRLSNMTQFRLWTMDKVLRVYP